MEIEYNDWNCYVPGERLTVYITFTEAEVLQFIKDHGMEGDTLEVVMKFMIEGGLNVGLGY